MTLRNTVAGLALVLLAASAQAQPESALIITGSDTMSGLLRAWSQDFRRRNPNVTIEIQGRGSGAAPTALSEGTANIGAMTRPMTESELRQVVRRRGVLPTQLRIARDALAIVVHPSNPFDNLALTDLDRIYSSQFLCGGRRAVRSWVDVTASSGSDRPSTPLRIEAYGRATLSGAYGFFRQRALCGGDFASDVIELPGYAAIVDAVASVEGAIGYVGVGFVDERVKVLTLSTAVAEGSLPERIRSETDSRVAYPLERDLFLYVVDDPAVQGRPRACTFLRYTQVPAAQAILARQGFLPAGPKRQPAGLSESSIDDLCT